MARVGLPDRLVSEDVVLNGDRMTAVEPVQLFVCKVLARDAELLRLKVA
jgi:hypothetical protein